MELFHHCSVVGRSEVSQNLRGAGGFDAPGADVVLNAHGNPGQGTGQFAGGDFLLNRFRLRQSLLPQDSDKSVVGLIFSGDGLQGSLGSLPDGHFARLYLLPQFQGGQFQ